MRRTENPRQRPFAAGGLSALQALLQVNDYGVAPVLADYLADIGPHGQLMSAIAHRHEGTSEWVTIDCTPDFHETLRPKK